MELTQERLKELLHYDPETGVFTRTQPRSNVKEGALAGCITSQGYLVIQIDNTLQYSHRLAYLYMHGEFPEGLLDHHDQDKANNRFGNLRPATESQNKMNVGLRSTNTSGHIGVCWHKGRQKWASQINFDLKKHFLGYYTNLEDAVAARKAAEITLGVSEFCPQ